MFTKKEIIDILKDNGVNNAIFEYADNIRKEYLGDEIHLRGLIEFSNICSKNCKYCGLQAVNNNLARYKMTPDEILSAASDAKERGYKTIVLQSGEGDFYKREELVEIIKSIKKLDVALTLSIGEKSKDDYKAFKDAGADRYLLRIETTDSKLYEKLHPNSDFKNRLKCLYELKELGYETGTGSIVGLFGQSIESIADDILFFKKLDADMVGIGPFIAHNDTPLKDCPNGDFELSLKVMALVRIILKDINIPATTAMETIHPNGRVIALKAGANVVMPNCTPLKYRKLYEIYPNKACTNDTPDKCANCIKNKILSIGRTISTDFGFRKKIKN